jgi:hypothetical protein
LSYIALTSPAASSGETMSFLHPELLQRAGWFDRFEPDSFRWFRAFFAWPSNTAGPVA